MFRTFYTSYNDTYERNAMETRTRVALAIAGVAIVAFSVGYQKGQSRTIRELGQATTSEAMAYLATADFIRNRRR